MCHRTVVSLRGCRASAHFHRPDSKQGCPSGCFCYPSDADSPASENKRTRPCPLGQAEGWRGAGNATPGGSGPALDGAAPWLPWAGLPECGLSCWPWASPGSWQRPWDCLAHHHFPETDKATPASLHIGPHWAPCPSVPHFKEKRNPREARSPGPCLCERLSWDSG